MQSFMDTAGPPPLSPSSLFTFDGESMMSNGGSGNGQDDGVDLFRWVNEHSFLLRTLIS